MLKIHSVVQLCPSSPLYGRLGAIMGTVVDVYEKPYKALEVEFCDSNGVTIEIVTVSENEIVALDIGC